MAHDLIMPDACSPALFSTGALAVPAPAPVMAEGATVRRYVEFFAARIRTSNTRAAYHRAASDFIAWCEHHSLG